MRPQQKRQQASNMHRRALFAPGWQAPAKFELPDEARAELKRRWWNAQHPTPHPKPAPKLTLFQRIVKHLAKLLLRLYLLLMPRPKAPVAPAPKHRKPSYERRQELRRAGNVLASAAARKAVTA